MPITCLYRFLETFTSPSRRFEDVKTIETVHCGGGPSASRRRRAGLAEQIGAEMSRDIGGLL